MRTEVLHLWSLTTNAHQHLLQCDTRGGFKREYQRLKMHIQSHLKEDDKSSESEVSESKYLNTNTETYSCQTNHILIQFSPRVMALPPCMWKADFTDRKLKIKRSISSFVGHYVQLQIFSSIVAWCDCIRKLFLAWTRDDMYRSWSCLLI